MKRLRRYLFLGLWAAGIQLAQANGVCEPDPAGARSRDIPNRWYQLIVDRKFEVLDQELDDRFQRVRKGDASDYLLEIDLGRVIAGDGSLQPLLIEWVKRRAESKYAPLVAGLYHVRQGYRKRGTKFASDTSAEQFAAMAYEFQFAEKFLKEALRRDVANGLAYSGLMDMAKAAPRKPKDDKAGMRTVSLRVETASSDAPDDVMALGQAGLNRAPGSVALRVSMLSAFSPRWGGSFKQMKQILAPIGVPPLKAVDQQYVAYRAYYEMADYERFVVKRQRDAMRYAMQAHEACPSTDALWLASEAGYDLEDWKVVRDLMTTYLGIEPGATRAYSKRGFASENLGDMSKAVEDYMRSIKLGDAWAMNRVGWFYETNRHLPKDLVKARALYEQAAAKGNPTAKEALAKMLAVQ